MKLIDIQIRSFKGLSTRYGPPFSLVAYDLDKTRSDQLLSHKVPEPYTNTLLSTAFIYYDLRIVELFKTIQQLIVGEKLPQQPTNLVFTLCDLSTIYEYSIALHNEAIVEEKVHCTDVAGVRNILYRKHNLQYGYIQGKKILVGRPARKDKSALSEYSPVRQFFQDIVVKPTTVQLPSQQIIVTSDHSLLQQYRLDQFWTCSPRIIEPLIQYRGLTNKNAITWYQNGRVGHSVKPIQSKLQSIWNLQVRYGKWDDR